MLDVRICEDFRACSRQHDVSHPKRSPSVSLMTSPFVVVFTVCRHTCALGFNEQLCATWRTADLRDTKCKSIPLGYSCNTQSLLKPDSASWDTWNMLIAHASAFESPEARHFGYGHIGHWLLVDTQSLSV